MPDRPSAPRTYVRTLVSGNRDSQGSAGTYGARTPDITNGTSPTQAAPSCASTVSPAGSNAWTTGAG